MILVEDILKLHDASIDDFGGVKGIRDMGLLESAVKWLKQNSKSTA